jgi:NADPH:quinone reductase-like Zn-dependent oxidoreductase
MERTMQAMVFEAYGDADVLQLVTVPRPDVGPTDVQIRVMAAGVNPADTAIRRGAFRLLLRLKLPFIPGSDVAGVVTQVGPEVTGFQPGDRVYAMIPMGQGGAYAEAVTLDEKLVVMAPASLDFPQIAATPLTALTALQALRDKAELQPGQRVLIYGASGGVGTFAVQIAQAMGATVTAVCSTRNVSMVRELGAETVIDYTTQDIASPAYREQFDVVLDAVAKLPMRQGLRVLKRGGMLVSVNPGLNNPLSKLAARLRGRRLQAVMVKPVAEDLRSITRWIEQGQVKPIIDRCWPLAEAVAAHRHSETGRAQGKIVLTNQPEAPLRAGAG